MKAQIVDTNLALCKIFGYSREELYGKPFTDYIPTERGDLKLYKQLMSGIPPDLKTTSRLGCQPGEHQQQLLAETSH